MKQKNARDGGSEVLDSRWNKNSGQGRNGLTKTVFVMVCQINKNSTYFSLK
jgi:hypothetical protein